MSEQSAQHTPAGTPMPDYVAVKVKPGHVMLGDEQTQTSAARWVCSKPTCRKFVATYPPPDPNGEIRGDVWGTATLFPCSAPSGG